MSKVSANVLGFNDQLSIGDISTDGGKLSFLLRDVRQIDAARERLGERLTGTPKDVFLCGFCSYGAVCRKDYVGDVV